MPKSVSEKRWRGIVTDLAFAKGVDPQRVIQKSRFKEIVKVRRQAFAALAGMGFSFHAIGRVSGFDDSTVALACDLDRLEKKRRQNRERNWNLRGQSIAQGPQA